MNYSYRVISIGDNKSKKVNFEGSYKDCVLYIQDFNNSDDTQYLDIIRSDSLLLVREQCKQDGTGTNTLRHLGQLDTQASYPYGDLKKLYSFLCKNSLSFTTICTANGDERDYSTVDFFSKSKQERVSIESTGFISIDGVTDIVLLALPNGVSEDVHSIDIRLNNKKTNDFLPINLWSRRTSDGNEFDIFVSHELGSVSYEL